MAQSFKDIVQRIKEMPSIGKELLARGERITYVKNAGNRCRPEAYCRHYLALRIPARWAVVLMVMRNANAPKMRLRNTPPPDR